MDVVVGATRCRLTYNTTATPPDAIDTISGRYYASEDGALLQCLNDEKAFLYIPVIVFLAVLVLTGTLGNTLVLCVYWRKPYKASSHYFILSLAILDLFSCVVGLPTEIADLRLPYLFDLPVACKLLRFTHSSTIIASSTILIQVAFDRYFRICKLGQQFSVRKAKLLCAMSILLGVLTSWPSCLLFGRKTLRLHVQTRERHVTSRGHVVGGVGEVGGGVGASVGVNDDGMGYDHDFYTAPLVRDRVLTASDCSTEDSMRGTIYPTIYYLFLFSLFFLTVSFFAVLYIRIGVAIWRRKRKVIGDKVVTKVISNGSDHTSTEMSSDVDGDGGSNRNNNNHHHHGKTSYPPNVRPHPKGRRPAPLYVIAGTGTLTRADRKQKKPTPEPPGTTTTSTRTSAAVAEAEMTPAHVAAHAQYYAQPGPQHQGGGAKRRQIRVGKTTTVLFAVTLAYILSFLPYLVVMVLRSTIRDFEGRLSPVGEVAYKFCVKSFFINNAINPLIYSFLNAGFRKDARKTLRRMWHACVCRCLCCCCCCCCRHACCCEGREEDDSDMGPPRSPMAV